MTDHRIAVAALRWLRSSSGRWRRRTSVVVSVLLWCASAFVGCSSETPPNPVKTAFALTSAARDLEASVAFRFAAGPRGGVALYQLPDLAPVDWDLAGTSPGTSRIVGFAEDDDLVYTLTGSAELVALDLTIGRTRVIDTNVVDATLGPTDIPYLLRADGTIGRVTRRMVVDWTTRAEPLPSAIWAGPRNRIVAVATTGDDRWLMSLADGRPTVMQRIPTGPIGIAPWGDVAVVSTDSGLAVFDPADPAGVMFRRLRTAPGPVVVSAAAHHIYTVDAEGKLLVYDRFELRRLRRLEMPGTATELRADPMGRLLLVRAADGETIWIVELGSWELVATITDSWAPDLPTVTRDGTVLMRQGADVVAIRGESFAVSDHVEGAADDLWLTAAWDPRRRTRHVAPDPVADAVSGSGSFYVQVSSTRNQSWAEDFAQNLRRAGMDANVLAPRNAEDLYRVVLGPFPTREGAESVSRQLGLPSWITRRDTVSGTP